MNDLNGCPAGDRRTSATAVRRLRAACSCPSQSLGRRHDLADHTGNGATNAWPWRAGRPRDDLDSPGERQSRPPRHAVEQARRGTDGKSTDKSVAGRGAGAQQPLAREPSASGGDAATPGAQVSLPGGAGRRDGGGPTRATMSGSCEQAAQRSQPVLRVFSVSLSAGHHHRETTGTTTAGDRQPVVTPAALQVPGEGVRQPRSLIPPLGDSEAR